MPEPQSLMALSAVGFDQLSPEFNHESQHPVTCVEQHSHITVCLDSPQGHPWYECNPLSLPVLPPPTWCKSTMNPQTEGQ